MSKKQLEQYLDNPNVRAFLGLIRDTEGTSKGADPYRVYGGSVKNQMESLDTPNFKKWSFSQTDGKKNSSTASGAYQFLERTWNNVAKQNGLTDFSPRSQDLAAIALLQQNGSLPYILEGDFGKAVQKSNRTWASLPGSPYAQKTRDMTYVNNSLQKHLGQQLDLNSYGSDDSPKQQALGDLISPKTPVQTNKIEQSLVTTKETQVATNHVETKKLTNLLTSLVAKISGLFHKR